MLVPRPVYLTPPHPGSRVKVFEHEGRYLADLIVSVDGDTDDEYMQRLREGVLGANRLLCDVTDGQITLHRVELHPDKGKWDEADIMITQHFYEDESVPRGGAHGITMVSKLTELRPGKRKVGQRIGEWVKLPFYLGGSKQVVPWHHRGLMRVFAHELCHYLLGVQDEYGGGGHYCECLVGDSVTTELCRDETHTDERREHSCWTKAKLLYPDLVVPVEPDPGPWDPPLPDIRVVR